MALAISKAERMEIKRRSAIIGALSASEFQFEHVGVVGYAVADGRFDRRRDG